MASHQTFYANFGIRPAKQKTNLLYIINWEDNTFTIGKQMSRQFSTFIICTQRKVGHDHVHYFIVWKLPYISYVLVEGLILV